MSDMMKVDLSKIDKFEAHLSIFNKRALPIANRTALNNGAFDARTEIQNEIERKMVLRNKWTKRSIQVKKATGNEMSNQEAIVGTPLDYLETQEFGGTKRKKGSEGVRMTTPYASGEGLTARPRRKLARGANKIRRIQLRGTKKRGANKRQQAIIAINEARKSGQKYVFLDMPFTKGKKGIFKVIGGKRKAKIRMVHSLKSQAVRINARPTFKPAVDKVRRRMPGHYLKALQFQIDRMRLFTNQP